jgi:hypothetical protein
VGANITDSSVRSCLTQKSEFETLHLQLVQAWHPLCISKPLQHVNKSFVVVLDQIIAVFFPCLIVYRTIQRVDYVIGGRRKIAYLIIELKIEEISVNTTLDKI